METDLTQLQRIVREHGLQLSLHAFEEALAEGISIQEVRETLFDGMIVEDYPSHQRG